MTAQTGVPRRRLVPRWAIGPLATIVLVAALEGLGKRVLAEPDAPLLLAVAFSAFVGGLRPGFASAVITSIYYAHAYSIPGHSFHYGRDEFSHLVELLVAVAAMAVMVGLLKHRRDRTFKALRLSEARHRLLFERSPAGIFRIGLDGRIIACNESYARIVGCASREDVLGHPVQSFLENPLDREIIVERLQREGALTNHMVRFRAKDGRLVDALMNNQKVEEGADTVFEGQVLDVTRERAAEDAVIQSERRYRDLVQEAPDGILSIDGEGRILTYNPAAERLSGYTAQEVIGRPFPELGLIAPHSLPAVLEDFQLLVAGVDRAPHVVDLVRKDGVLVTVEAHPRLIRRDGAPVAAEVVLRDVTERKRADAAERRAVALESVTQLAGAAAHEINNPLAIIAARADLLLARAEPDSPLRQPLGQIITATKRIQDLVAHMARITHLETADQHPGLPCILDIRKSAEPPDAKEPRREE
jgi:PAS domain S-box-containing protein